MSGATKVTGSAQLGHAVMVGKRDTGSGAARQALAGRFLARRKILAHEAAMFSDGFAADLGRCSKKRATPGGFRELSRQ
jgi:hypothetical protein